MQRSLTISNPRQYAGIPLNRLNVIKETVLSPSLIPASGLFQYDLAPLQGDEIKVLGTFVFGATKAARTGFAFPSGSALVAANANLLELSIELADLVPSERFSALEAASMYYRDYGTAPETGKAVWFDGSTMMGFPGEFQYPLYYFGMLQPAAYSSLKLLAQVDINGQSLANGYVKILENYFQAIV